MVLKKVCCLSLRMGSLVLLYIQLIDCAWKVLSVLSDAVGDPTVDEYIGEFAPLFYMDLFLSIIGGLIYLATIVSITKKKPSNSWLNASMLFLILGVIYCVYAMLLFNSNDFKNFYHEAMYESAQELTKDPKAQEEFVKFMDEMYGAFIAVVCLVLFCDIALAIYSVLVFHSYMAEMKENISNDVPLPLNGKTNPEEGYSRVPPPYASQYDTQPPQYFVNV